MKTIDGRELARKTRAEIAAGVAALKAERGVTPGLAVILVGDNPASVSYVGLKGSDPSVYALLYMLDFGAADVVACAAS